MVGLELQRVGFNTIHASDMSVEIIKRAEDKVNILKNKLFLKNKCFQGKMTPLIPRFINEFINKKTWKKFKKRISENYILFPFKKN